MKVLGFGDCCVDYYISEQTAYPGGNALNVAVFSGENGAEAAFLGTIGTDEIGKHIMACAEHKKIDISHCRICRGISGRAAVNIIDGNRVFDGTFFGEEHGVGTLYPPKLKEDDLVYMKEFDLIHGSCYAHIENEFAKLKSLPVILSFDFSGEDEYRSESYLKEICPGLDLGLFSCEHMDRESRETLADTVRKYGCRNVLMTMGAGGQCFITENGHVYTGKAKHIVPVDTMGAGDSFCAAFIVSLLKSGWKKNTEISGAMAKRALLWAAEYSAGNCLIRGSFGCGMKIVYRSREENVYCG